MSRKIISLLCLLCAAVLPCSCGISGLFRRGQEKNGNDAQAELIERAESFLQTAERQSDAGMSISGGYFYGMAQAEVSSLRLCVDTLLWLLGEGENLEEVIGDAPYRDWDSITAAGLGSDAPFYFEGLILTFRGREAEAKSCYEKAGANPNHAERDFYYLRHMSTDELYTLRDELRALEDRIASEYTPRTVLCAARTGAEFSPEYHLALAQLAEDPANAAQCALNALFTSPYEAALYSAAAAYALDASDAGLGTGLINEGLFLYPEDAELNYLAALVSLSSGDADGASAYLDTAEKSAGSDLKPALAGLRSKIGGLS